MQAICGGPGACLSDPMLDASRAPSRIHAALLACWKSRFADLELLKLSLFFFSPIDGFRDGKLLAIVKARNRSDLSTGVICLTL